MTFSSVSNLNNVPFLFELVFGLIFGLGYIIFQKFYQNHSNSTESIKGDNVEIWDKCSSLEDFKTIIKINEKEINPLQILNKIIKKGFVPDINVYNNLINACYKKNDFITSDNLIAEVLNPISNFQTDIVFFNTIFKGISIQLDSNSYHTPKDKIKEKFQFFWDKLINSKLALHQITLNIIIDIYVKLDEFDKAWEVFENMNSLYKVKPNKYTYSTILKIIKNDVNPEKLNKCFETIELIRENPFENSNKVIFNSLLEGCFNIGNYEKAENIFNEMKELKVIPNKITYSIMIKVYGKMGNLQKAFDIFEEFKSNIGETNDVIYGSILNTCLICNDLKKVVEVFEEIKLKNIKINNILYTTIIKAYSKLNDHESAYKLFNDLMTLPQELNTACYNAMLDFFVECSDFNKVDEIFKKIQENSNFPDKPKPDIITYTIVIKAFCKSKNFDKTFEIYENIKNNSELQLDEIIYNQLLDACAKTGNIKKATSIRSEMELNKIKKSNITYSTLFKLYIRSGNEQKAMEILSEMKQNDILPGNFIYSSFIQYYLNKEECSKAMKLFYEMKTQGIKPNHVIYNIIVMGCLKRNEFENAAKLTLETFGENIRMEMEIYFNVLKRLCQNSCKLKNKCDYISKIISELKSKKAQIDYEILKNASSTIYNIQGKKVDFSRN